MTKEVVTVAEDVVACEGNGPALGHPKVFLTFKTGEDKVVCPYCSRTFLRAGEPSAADAH